MVDNRTYILDRIKSRGVSLNEFNFDNLKAPPIASMFSNQDISQLNYIAKSIKYSAKPQVKYQEIDKIMRSRGFEKFVGGTNRIAYRHLENNSIIAKVAYDAVGCGDNPREFKNQFIFKPFVTKVFEATPCGTLGIFERVIPITSREEYLSIAEDVFDMINEWFIGEYVLEDIGSKFFMNIGIRKNWGPVLLDFPYVYKLDGNKLFCNSPDPGSPTGLCEGVIDYDAGYNFLHCTKCGVKYKAKELEEAINNKAVIIRSQEGESRMRISVTGGSKDVNNIITIGNGSIIDVKSIPRKPIKEYQKTPEKYGNPKYRNNKPHVTAVEQEVVEEVTVEPTAHAESPYEALVNFIDNVDDNTVISAFSSFLTTRGLSLVSSEQVAKLTEMEEYVKETKYVEAVVADIRYDIKDHYTSDDLVDILKVFTDIVKKFDDEEYVDKISDFLTFLPRPIISKLFSKLLGADSSFAFVTSYDNITAKTDDEGNDYIAMTLYTDIADDIDDGNDVFTSSEDEAYNITIAVDTLKEAIGSIGLSIVDSEETSESSSEDYAGMHYMAAQIFNPRDIITNTKHCKAIGIIDDKGDYVTDDSNKIIAIIKLDDKMITDIAVVPKLWADEKIKDKINDNEDKEDVSIENETAESDPAVSVPTGSAPPSGFQMGEIMPKDIAVGDSVREETKNE